MMGVGTEVIISGMQSIIDKISNRKYWGCPWIAVYENDVFSYTPFIEVLDEENPESSYVVNFYHKPTGFSVSWGKHLRDRLYYEDIDHDHFFQILCECLDSI